MKNTKTVDGRRNLRYENFEAVKADLDEVLSQPHEALGNWGVAQIIDHVALGMELPINGYPPFFQKMPLPLKVFGRLFKGYLLKKGFSPGIQPKGEMKTFFTPREGVTTEQALERFNAAIERFQAGETIPVNPMLGKLTKAQWEQFNCRHAELHFSFIVPRLADATT